MTSCYIPNQKHQTHSSQTSQDVGKKDRKIKYDNLQILLDSSCLDSIDVEKYEKKDKKKLKLESLPLEVVN